MSQARVQMTQQEFERRIDRIKVCGVNRGPHDYIHTSWIKSPTAEHVSTLMCRVCFTRVNITTLYEQFDEAKV